MEPELHDNPHQQFINMMSHSRRCFSKLDPKLYGQVTTISCVDHSGSSKICFVTDQDGRLASKKAVLGEVGQSCLGIICWKVNVSILLYP